MIGIVTDLDRPPGRGTIRAQGGGGDYTFDLSDVDGNLPIERGVFVAFIPGQSPDGTLIAWNIQPERPAGASGWRQAKEAIRHDRKRKSQQG